MSYLDDKVTQALTGIRKILHLNWPLLFQITSNRSVGEGGSVFGAPVLATATLDRLLHHPTVITIRGDSCRLREKHSSGLLQKA